MPKFTLHQHHVNLLIDLVRGEIEDVKSGETFYPDNEDILADLTVIQALLTAKDLE